jgi:hypothetical protein
MLFNLVEGEDMYYFSTPITHIVSKISLYLLPFIYISICIFTGCSKPISEDKKLSHPAFCGIPSMEQQLCLRPWLPYLERIHLGAQWLVSHPYDLRVRVGVSYDLEAEQPTQWNSNTTLNFSKLGFIKVFIYTGTYPAPTQSNLICDSLVSSHIYEVVETYDPQADTLKSLAITMEDSRFIAWGEEIDEVIYGANVLPRFQTPEKALGIAKGNALDVVSLGQGGEITFFFKTAIANGFGHDFAIFENSFSDLFLELARVEVSSDGTHFVPLPHAYLGKELISGFGQNDPTLIFGLVGKYKAGYGTPFDLSTLAWSIEAQQGILDLHAIHYVKIIDIVGNGETYDTFQHPIYDPYPTKNSAGIDIDAIGVLHSSDTDPCPF